MPNTRVVCPTCATPLELDATYIGQEVECGSCNQIFEAKAQPRRHDDDEDRPRRRTDEDYDDDDNDRPRRRRRRRSAVNSNSTATVALVLGIISLPMAFCCGLFSLPLSIGAIICGAVGLKGESGRGSAVAGMILGGIGLVLSIGMVILGLAMQNGPFGGRGGGNQWNNAPPPRQPFNQPRNFR